MRERYRSRSYPLYIRFRTEVDPQWRIGFGETFRIEAHALEISAAVDLSGVDPILSGHPQLRISVTHRGAALGRGVLSPGHFVDLEGGYRVGFVGLKMWTEVDVARPSPRTAILGGFGVMALGLVVSLVGWLARR